jgi:hypothetical protein
LGILQKNCLQICLASGSRANCAAAVHCIAFAQRNDDRLVRARLRRWTAWFSSTKNRSGPDAYGLMQTEMPQTEDANKPDGDQINGDNETQ